MDFLSIDLNGFHEIHELAKRDALENISTQYIQSLARGFIARKQLLGKIDAVQKIQRLFRGHETRINVNKLKAQKQNEINNKINDYFACQIQKFYRGYHVRHFDMDYYERKSYLHHVGIVGVEIRDQMNEYHEQCKQQDEKEKESKNNKNLKETAEKLHHLLSTNQQRGIFNPPPEVLETPTIDNIPVEHVLRNVVRDLLRTKGVGKTPLVNDLHGSRTIPMKLSKSRLSLQASSSYDMETIEEKRLKDIHKIILKQQNKTDNFLAGTKTNIIDNVEEPLCINEEYMDPYRNPAMMRGEPGSLEELKLSLKDRKPYFIKKLERPYYVRGDGNKSTALHNDLFDVIYEAEQVGGSAQRHLGTQLGLTKSFGIPNTADNAHYDEAHEFYKTIPSLNKSIRLGTTTRQSNSASKPKRTRNILEEDSDDEI